MGVCLSCLRGANDDDAERQRLLYEDYPSSNPYGTWTGSQPIIPPEDLMSPAEIQRERGALDTISRSLSDHVVEIFPHNLGLGRSALGQMMSNSQILSGYGTGNGNSHLIASDNSQTSAEGGEGSGSQHQDILLSLIPGDKSKRSIRIYPPSRPTSKSGIHSLRSRSSVTGGMNGSGKGGGSSILVTLDVNLP